LKSKLVYTGIRVKSMDESVKFYTELLGMTLKDRSKLEATGGEVAGLYCVKGGPEIELNYYPEGNKFASEYTVGEGLDHLAFHVDDLDGALAELAAAGHPAVLEIKSESSRWAYVQDPNGIYVELFA
jgi:catechol 2,3-dioxygenase-like lactoylglutathione lyase family enzyme